MSLHLRRYQGDAEEEKDEVAWIYCCPFSPCESKFYTHHMCEMHMRNTHGHQLSQIRMKGVCVEIEEDEDDDDDDDEFSFGQCGVCLKEDNTHCTFDCPYLKCIPNAKDTIVGEWYEMQCNVCHRFGVHASHGWKGRAVRKYCSFCNGPHWSLECSKNPHRVDSVRRMLEEYENEDEDEDEEQAEEGGAIKC